jgi:hypothetical protein
LKVARTSFGIGSQRPRSSTGSRTISHDP